MAGDWDAHFSDFAPDLFFGLDARFSDNPDSWRITGLNDQHAYLRWDGAPPLALQVGDRVALGISHPCTTFDKWSLLMVVDEENRVVDAVKTFF